MKRKTIVILLLLGALFGITWLCLESLSRFGQRRLDEQIAQIEDADTVLDLEKLYVPSIDDEDNAAIGLLSAFEMRVEDREEISRLQEKLYTESDSLSEDEEGALAEWMNSQCSLWETVDKALEKSNCRFKIDFSDVVNASMPHLSHLRSLVNLSKAEALMRVGKIVRGDPYVSCFRIFHGQYCSRF